MWEEKSHCYEYQEKAMIIAELAIIAKWDMYSIIDYESSYYQLFQITSGQGFLFCVAIHILILILLASALG